MSSEAWRTQFRQADRNKQVKEIARVLASLEPGASAKSKFRLAMQFEDTVFHAADSLDDYQKRLSKRLRKLQKNYKPDKAPEETEREKKMEALREQSGKAILYCVRHAATAVKEMRKRQGDEKAKQLERYLEAAKRWASDLGLLENSVPNKSMTDEYLEQMSRGIERGLETLRQHVIKLADPDQYFIETLDKADEDSRGPGANILAPHVQKRYAQFYKTTMEPNQVFQDSMRQATLSVPLPTRSQSNDERAALIWLEKMRAAPTAALAFVATKDKSAIPKGTMSKLHKIATEGTKFVTEVIQNRRKQQKTPEVSLEDAWMKPLPIPTTGANKLDTFKDKPLVTRAKILFIPGRKTPPNLLSVFRMKQATLVRPPPRGEGSHLILKFGKAFVMTIYFVPLVVRLTAFVEERATTNENADCAPWVSVSQGLTQRDDLTVWGAKGNYAELGHIVEERLTDASAHATRVLRKIFTNNVKENAPEFEQEILEGTAVVEFLQLARTTYVPNWKDDI